MAEQSPTAVQLRFQTLWQNYPNNDPCINPKTGKRAYDDQCAIRLGLSLQKSGVDFSKFPGPRCEFGARGNGMVLRAEELANWLRSIPFRGCPVAQSHAGKNFQASIAGRTGIVFFKDYWLRSGERHPTGDHIDLWNRDCLTPSFTTFLRFSLGISRMPSPLGPGNYYSDLSNASQVLFWPLP